MNTRPSIRRFRPLSLLFLTLAFGAATLAAHAEAEEKANPLPPRVDKLLRKMSDRLAQAETFALEARILFDEVLDSGLLVQRAATLKVLAQRPNGLHATFKTDTEEKKFWYDGKVVTLLDVDDNVYAKTKVPDKIGPALDHLMDKYGISLALSDFFYENPYEALTGSVDRALYIGMSQVNGIPCHHLVFSQETIDWQLWIEDGERSVPRKLVIVYKNTEGNPQYMATLTGVKLREALPASIFTPTLPEDAITIDLLEIVPKVTPK
jgi:hypothetical protein